MKKFQGPKKAVGYGPRIVVKFHDYVDIPYKDGAESFFKDHMLGPWDQLTNEYPGITLRRLYTSVDPKRIRSLVDKAVEQDNTYRPPNLLSYFVIDCPPNVNPDELAKKLSSWRTVQTAYYDPPGEEPIVNPNDDPRFINQGYLDSAPDGIDAEYGWGILGGDGQGQRYIDLERGWTLDHEDHLSHGATLLHGSIRDGSRAHGTSVLGESSAVDNSVGCVGIAPNVASVDVVSYWTSTRPDAILAAINSLSFGDVLLLEAHLIPPSYTTYYPIEVLDAEFDTIRLATALGIVVIEAGGNGGNDLDNYTNSSGDTILNRGSTDFRDSGAILVGAATSTSPHVRLDFSNFGSRIDCYAWGENVNTLTSNDSGATALYTTTFGGTSSASPIITGAALIVQGIVEAGFGYRLSPRQMRNILSAPATGTASNNPPVDRIGVMPDLQQIIDDALDVKPIDLYIRDFVGDTGDVHTGSISSSPDLILLPTLQPDPQASFGQGSGTENSNTLGSQATAGQDNFVYVRLRNRGGSSATNVTATVFWSPVSTLITPDLWTLVGSVVIPNVPDGDILTVSNAITWAASNIPGEGHYCFVGLIGSSTDPAPAPAEFMNWDNFRFFIRNNNNVTWRNFNVVNNEPAPNAEPSGFVDLPFLVSGAPDKARWMSIEVVARLPQGARALLEVPLELLDQMNTIKERLPYMKIIKKQRVALIPLNPHGRQNLGEAIFPAKSRWNLRLLVQIPKNKRQNEYEVYVKQIFNKEEVGRVTWHLMKKNIG